MQSNGWRAAALLSVLVLGACAEDPSEPVEQEPDTLVEARALWISRYEWRTQAELVALIEGAAQARFNLIYFQVRGQADAFYRPGLEPWSDRLAGRLGQDPGWDPLDVALRTARQRGLELHAWINAFPAGGSSGTPIETTPRHVLLQHPHWVMVDAAGKPLSDGTYRWLSPASPGARQHLAAVAADIARRYAVDGIHLDYIRYPFAQPADAASQAAYDSARVRDPSLTLDEFRRGLVTDAVRLVSDSVRAARPRARLSAAVWGIYQNTALWANVSTGYGDRLQAARAWAAAGIIDALVPMVYWTMKQTYQSRLDFAYLAEEYARAVTGRHVYVGMSLTAIIAENPTDVPGAITRHIERTRLAGAEGVSVFSATPLKDRAMWSALAAGPFKQPARIPSMAWKPGGSATAFR